MTYTFKHVCEDYTVEYVINENDAVTWDYLAQRFTEFVRGCGFIFDSHAEFRLVDGNSNDLTAERRDFLDKCISQTRESIDYDNNDDNDEDDSFMMMCHGRCGGGYEEA